MSRLWERLKQRSQHQGGYVVVATALAFVALAVPVTLASLQLTDTLTISSAVNRDNLLRGSTTHAAIEHALWRLIFEPGYAEGLNPTSPTDNYPFTLNEITADVTVTYLGGEPTATATPIHVVKSVDPKYAPENTLTSFTYTITLINDDYNSHYVSEIEDELPSGFYYVAGSTSGLTSADPAVDDDNELTWNFSPDYPEIPPKGGELTLQFRATSSQSMDTRHNEVEAEITGLLPGDGDDDDDGDGEFETGYTAQVRFLRDDEGKIDVTIGVTPTAVQSGEETEFTYIISMVNNDDVSHDYKDIINTLPPGFAYIGGSTTGITNADPQVYNENDDDLFDDEEYGLDSQRLKWNFSQPYPTIGPHGNAQLSFKARATLARATYFDYATVSFTDLNSAIRDIETGPTASVRGEEEKYKINAEGPDKGITTQVSIGGGTADFLTWEER